MVETNHFIGPLQGITSNSIMIPNKVGGTAPVLRRESTVATSVPIAEIISLAIGGPAFFACLVLLVIFYLRRKHHREKTKLKELEDANVAKQMGVPLRSIPTPKLCLSERSSFNPFLLPGHASAIRSNEWLEDESMMDSPPMTRAKSRRLSQKGLFQISGIRDSWPLTASMPSVSLRLLQPNSSLVTLNQVGGGGYVVPPEPKWPGRTYSRKSRTKIVVSMEESNMQRFSTGSYGTLGSPRRPRHQRRSASENQLSTILRSTSHRLKSAHRKSLSRTLTSFGRSPGPPPDDRLKTPRKPASESREVLIQPDDIESVTSSIEDTYFNQSPSPTRKQARSSGQGSFKRRASITPSAESIDSLCAGATPDLVIPAALRSPDKKVSRSPQRHAMRISSSGAKDLSDKIHEEGRASAWEPGTRGSPEEKAAFTNPHRISLASDPFYSYVKSGKRVMPQNKIIGPRPLYIRQTTFGQEATTERPASFVSTSPSPLRNISGNAQSPPRPNSSARYAPSEPTSNPFSWEPQEPMATLNLSNPLRAGSRQKVHKRTHLVRISIIPRPPSVCPVPEEEEDCSPLRFSIPLNAPMRVFEPNKSPNPKPSSILSLRLSTRPPSITTFNPVLSIPELVENIRVPADNSPTLGFHNALQIYSPTLAASNYYSEGRTSQDEFFNPKLVKPNNPSLPNPQFHQKQHSISHLPHPEHKELFSFPPLALNSTVNPRISLPSLRPLTANSTAPILLASPPSLPAPPILTHPSHTPSHLNGPRTESPKRLSASNPNLLGLPRDSMLHQSICLLRRMNSEISRCSTISASSNGDEEGRSPPRSPHRSSPDTGSRHWRRKERVSRGSHAYLSMGMGDSPRKSRVGKRQSTRDCVAERQKIKEEDEEDGLVEWERKGLDDVREGRGKSSSAPNPSSSPDLMADQVKCEPTEVEELRIPTLSQDGVFGTAHELPPRQDSLMTEMVTPTSPSQASPLKTVRWSDATPSPTIRVIRHESQLLQPSPQTPPVWGWRVAAGGKGKEVSDVWKEEVEGVEDVKENMVMEGEDKGDVGNWNENFGRSDSLSLYDSKGFLKSSPEKPAVVEI